MTDMESLLPLIMVAILVSISVAHYRLIRDAQPLRLMLAEKGERLLAQRGLPEEVRRTVEFMLDTAFDVSADQLIAAYKAMRKLDPEFRK